MNLVSARNPARHVILDNDATEIGRFIGREFPQRPGLFVYFHLRTRAFVVAQFEYQSQTHFHDVLNLGKWGLHNFSPDKLRRRLNPEITGRQMIEGMNREEHADILAENDTAMTEAEMCATRKIQIVTP